MDSKWPVPRTKYLFQNMPLTVFLITDQVRSIVTKHLVLQARVLFRLAVGDGFPCDFFRKTYTHPNNTGVKGARATTDLIPSPFLLYTHQVIFTTAVPNR